MEDLSTSTLIRKLREQIEVALQASREKNHIDEKLHRLIEAESEDAFAQLYIVCSVLKLLEESNSVEA